MSSQATSAPSPSESETLPLRSLRVIEVGTGYALALAGMVMTDFGADTVKVEPAEGDPERRRRAFAMLNRGKRSYVADLSDPAGQSEVHALCESADVVIVALPPSEAAACRMGEASVRAHRTDVIYCAITGFGPKGPYADYPAHEQVVTLKSGRGSFYLGQAARIGPVYPAVAIGGYSAAMGALQGICAALHERSLSGRGHSVRASLLQGITAYDMGAWRAAQQTDDYKAVLDWDGRGKQRAAALGYVYGATKDGHWLQFTQLASHLYYAFMKALGLESLYEEERFMGLPNVAPDAAVEAWRIIMGRLREKTLDEWMAIFGPDSNITAELVRTPQWAAEHPQVQHNGDVIDVIDPVFGRARHLAPLFVARATPGAPRFGFPTLGAANGHVDWEAKPVRATSAAPRVGEGPLAGIIVVEIATYFAAPFGPTLLADLGARVIKIQALTPEQPMGDGPQKVTQGKDCVSLDLKSPEGLAILYRLVEKADAFMHNFRSGVAARLGVDYATLSRLNPRVVYLNAVAYGVDGPNSMKPAYDPMPGAVTGSAWRQGGGHLPTDPATTQQLDFEGILDVSRSAALANWGFSDPSAALGVGTALVAGLLFRDLTGKGQELMSTMVRSNLYLNASEMLVIPGAESDEPAVDGDFLGTAADHRLYEAADGSWVFLGCTRDSEWAAFVERTGDPRLTVDRFRTSSGRKRNAAELSSLLGELFVRRHADEWEALTAANGLPCVRADGPSFGAFSMKDPQVIENGFVAEIEDSSGRYLRHGAIVHVDGPPRYLRGSDMFAESTSKVLRELGFTDDEIGDLHDRRVVRLRERMAEAGR